MYYSNARKTAKNFAVFLHIKYATSKTNKPKKEEINIEKEIQNQPSCFGGV